ncbi:MAG: hypothetical protein RL199_1100, partial [Pseudomonadota bacterium]
MRLDALATGRGGLSPELFASALQAGGVTIDGRRVADGARPLALREQLLVTLLERGRLAAGASVLDAARILLLDPDVVAVDKPPHLAAQGTLSDASAGLDAAVSRLLAARGRRPFVGLVHRLDLETSGVTVFGRTPEAVTGLAAQFRDGTVEKRYRLLVAGAPRWNETVVDAPLAGDVHRPGHQVVSPRGRRAKTVFTCLTRFSRGGVEAALLEARPVTGRTHQIRVHAAHAGLPLLGDRKYGGTGLLTLDGGVRLSCPRVTLHAAS